MSLGLSTLSLTGGAGFLSCPQPATATAASATALSRFQDRELNASSLQPLGQSRAHGLRGRDLSSGLRQFVVRQAEGRFGEHLRGLAVPRVAAPHLADHTLAAALAVKVDAKPRLRSLLLGRAGALRQALLQELPRRRYLRKCEDAGDAEWQRDRLGQVLDGDVVAIGEVGAVALAGPRGAHDDLRVDRRERQHPAVDVAIVARASVLGLRDPPVRALVETLAFARRFEVLTHPRKAGERRGEGAA